MARSPDRGGGFQPSSKARNHYGDVEKANRDGNLVDIPMNGTARESVKGIALNSGDTAGISGPFYDVNEAACINEAERLDREGYGTAGLNIATGRTRRTKYSGEK